MIHKIMCCYLWSEVLPDDRDASLAMNDRQEIVLPHLSLRYCTYLHLLTTFQHVSISQASASINTNKMGLRILPAIVLCHIRTTSTTASTT